MILVSQVSTALASISKGEIGYIEDTILSPYSEAAEITGPFSFAGNKVLSQMRKDYAALGWDSDDVERNPYYGYQIPVAILDASGQNLLGVRRLKIFQGDLFLPRPGAGNGLTALNISDLERSLMEPAEAEAFRDYLYTAKGGDTEYFLVGGSKARLELDRKGIVSYYTAQQAANGQTVIPPELLEAQEDFFRRNPSEDARRHLDFAHGGIAVVQIGTTNLILKDARVVGEEAGKLVVLATVTNSSTAAYPIQVGYRFAGTDPWHPAPYRVPGGEWKTEVFTADPWTSYPLEFQVDKAKEVELMVNYPPPGQIPPIWWETNFKDNTVKVTVADPDLYVSAISPGTSKVKPGEQYQGNVAFGLKVGYPGPVEASLELTHNGYPVPGVNGEMVTFQPGETKSFPFSFTGQDADSVLTAKIRPVSGEDADWSDNAKSVTVPAETSVDLEARLLRDQPEMEVGTSFEYAALAFNHSSKAVTTQGVWRVNGVAKKTVNLAIPASGKVQTAYTFTMPDVATGTKYRIEFEVNPARNLPPGEIRWDNNRDSTETVAFKNKSSSKELGPAYLTE